MQRGKGCGDALHTPNPFANCAVLWVRKVDCGIVELWNCGIVELWNCGIAELWNCGIVELWNCGILELWNCGIGEDYALVLLVTQSLLAHLRPDSL